MSFGRLLLMFASSTLHKSWLLSLIFSPYGRDEREEQVCGSPFSAACNSKRMLEHAEMKPESDGEAGASTKEARFKQAALKRNWRSFTWSW